MSRNWTGPRQVAFFFCIVGASCLQVRSTRQILHGTCTLSCCHLSGGFRVLQVFYFEFYKSILPDRVPLPPHFTLLTFLLSQSPFTDVWIHSFDSWKQKTCFHHYIEIISLEHELAVFHEASHPIAYLHTLFYRPRNQRPSIRMLTNLYNLGILWVGDFYKHCRFFLTLD